MEEENISQDISNPKKENFWCEQDTKWHPKCSCSEQCFECGLVENNENLTKTCDCHKGYKYNYNLDKMVCVLGCGKVM